MEDGAESEVHGLRVRQRGEAARVPGVERWGRQSGRTQGSGVRPGRRARAQAGREDVEVRSVEQALGQLRHIPLLHQLLEAGPERGVPCHPRHRHTEPVHDVPASRPCGDDGTGQLGHFVDDQVRPPGLGAVEQIRYAAVGGRREQLAEHEPQALVRRQACDLRVRDAEARLVLRAAVPHPPRRHPVTAHVIQQVRAGGQHDLVPGPLRGQGQRQHRVDMPMSPAGGDQDAHEPLPGRRRKAGASLIRAISG